MAHIRMSMPEPDGLGFLVQVLKPFYVVPSSLGNAVGPPGVVGGYPCYRRYPMNHRGRTIGSPPLLGCPAGRVLLALFLVLGKEELRGI